MINVGFIFSASLAQRSTVARMCINFTLFAIELGFGGQVIVCEEIRADIWEVPQETFV
jgi:hypothetical protein